jgi:hypothetical protein
MPTLRVRPVRNAPIVVFVGAAPLATPSAEHPVIDDRAPASRMIVLGTSPGRTVHLRLMRQFAADAPLHLRATSGAFRITAPRGRVLRGSHHDVTLVAGDSPGSGDLEVHIGETMVSTLRVEVRSLLRVRVATWLVRVDSRSEDGTPPSLPDVTSLFEYVNALWAPAGIEFVLETHDDVRSIAGSHRDELDPRSVEGADEVDSVLASGGTPNALNVYFVRGFFDQPHLLGQTYDRSLTAARSVVSRGIPVTLPATTTRTGMILKATSADTAVLARTVAHEIGHFFGLQHPYTPPPAPAGSHDRPDPRYAGSLQFLMHWAQPSGGLIPQRRFGGMLEDNGVAEARSFVESNHLAMP